VQLAERIAGSRHVVVPDTGHLSILWSSTLNEQIQEVVEKARDSIASPTLETSESSPALG
jgi:hypothetical protein